MPAAARQPPATLSPRQEKLLNLGRLAASAGLTVAELSALVQARRTRALAAAMREDNAVVADWLARGAPADDAPDPEAAIKRWQATTDRTGRARN